MKLRSAEPKDAESIATILSDWIDETDWMPRIHTREEDRGFGAFLIDKTEVTVAEDRAIRGFIACREATIDALYVARGARGAGIGSALLEHAKHQAGRLGLWVFQANTEALGFYERRGFSETQRTDGSGNDEKLPDIHMVWEGVRDG